MASEKINWGRVIALGLLLMSTYTGIVLNYANTQDKAEDSKEKIKTVVKKVDCQKETADKNEKDILKLQIILPLVKEDVATLKIDVAKTKELVIKQQAILEQILILVKKE